MLKSLTTRHASWSVGVFVSDSPAIEASGDPILLLDSCRLLRAPWDIRIRADPFLLVSDERLYMFIETQIGDRPGTISAYVTDDLRDWRSLGEILREPFHLSYPQVVEIGDRHYLMPEARRSGQLRLYRFDDFPGEVVFERVLLDAPVTDPTPFHHQGMWYLFATIGDALRLFVTDDLVGGELRPHPAGIIETRKDYRRNGGPIIERDGRLYRLSQAHRHRYGDHLCLFEIERLTPDAYRETLICDDLPFPAFDWSREGCHHSSAVRFQRRWVTAIDGQVADFYVHKITDRMGGWLHKTYAAAASSVRSLVARSAN